MKIVAQMQDMLAALEAGTYSPDAPTAWRNGAIAMLQWILRAED